MNVLVWGTHPVAGWLAGRFHQTGHHTKWLTSDTIAADYRRFKRLELISPKRQLTINDLVVGTSIDELLRPPLDWIVLAMPTWAIGEAVRDMVRRIPPQNCPAIVVVSHGIGGLEKVQNAFPDTPVLQAFSTRLFQWTMLSNDSPAYETILSDGVGGFGLTAGDKSAEAQALLQAADIGPVVIHPDQALQWSDLLWQIQANALPTLMQQTPAQIYADAYLYGIEYRQLREAIQIIDRQQIALVDLPGVDIRRLGWQIRVLPPEMLRQVLRPALKPPTLGFDLVMQHGRSDAAYLNGMVAKAANAVGLSAPVNYTLAVSITDVAEGRALWSQFTPDYLATLLRIADRHTT